MPEHLTFAMLLVAAAAPCAADVVGDVQDLAKQVYKVPPQALASEAWARDFNEVKSLGARNSTQRTPAQIATEKFFASTGPQQLVDSIPDIPAETGTSLADRARYLALLYMVLNDTSIAHFDAKYACNFWRPVTAIRNADQDGNDATARDATWVPLIDTPMHPVYPCAHCNVSTAFATIAFTFLGRGDAARPLSLHSAATPGAAYTTRQWKQAKDLGADVADARVWSGVHYRNSGVAGMTMGAALGEYILATQMRPLR